MSPDQFRFAPQNPRRESPPANQNQRGISPERFRLAPKNESPQRSRGQRPPFSDVHRGMSPEQFRPATKNTWEQSPPRIQSREVHPFEAERGLSPDRFRFPNHNLRMEQNFNPGTRKVPNLTSEISTQDSMPQSPADELPSFEMSTDRLQRLPDRDENESQRRSPSLEIVEESSPYRDPNIETKDSPQMDQFRELPAFDKPLNLIPVPVVPIVETVETTSRLSPTLQRKFENENEFKISDATRAVIEKLFPVKPIVAVSKSPVRRERSTEVDKEESRRSKSGRRPGHRRNRSRTRSRSRSRTRSRSRSPSSRNHRSRARNHRSHPRKDRSFSRSSSREKRYRSRSRSPPYSYREIMSKREDHRPRSGEQLRVSRDRNDGKIRSRSPEASYRERRYSRDVSRSRSWSRSPERAKPSCSYCSAPDHSMANCTSFLRFSLEERWKVIFQMDKKIW